MSLKDFDDKVMSLGSVESDYNQVKDDLDVKYFVIEDFSCACPHQVGNYLFICHRLDDKCSCDHSTATPKAWKLETGIYKIHRTRLGAFKGVLYRHKQEGDDLKSYLDSERKTNQNLALQATGIENLQSPSTSR